VSQRFPHGPEATTHHIQPSPSSQRAEEGGNF
jgi:hypothetical protein